MCVCMSWWHLANGQPASQPAWKPIARPLRKRAQAASQSPAAGPASKSYKNHSKTNDFLPQR